MHRLKKLLTIPAINAVCLFLLLGLAQAEERYIADTIVVSLREGPGPQYNVIKTLQTGQSFEVLETRNNFIRVRTKDGDEGWLQDQFTSPRPPAAGRSKGAAEPNATVTPKNEQPPVSASGTAQTVKDNAAPATGNETAAGNTPEAEPAETAKEPEQQENDAPDVLRIKAENDRLKKELATMQVAMAQLQQTNDALANREEIYWFLTGSGVLFLGMILGRISFRRQRHHSSLTL